MDRHRSCCVVWVGGALVLYNVYLDYTKRSQTKDGGHYALGRKMQEEPFIYSPQASAYQKSVYSMEAGSPSSQLSHMQTMHTPPSTAALGSHGEAFDRLLRSPDVRRRIEEHPASLRFHQMRALGYDDVLTDGFRAMFSKELLLVDARRDTDLYGFMHFLHKDFPASEPGNVAHITGVAKAIGAGFGGSMHHEHVPGEDLEARWRQRLQQLRLDFPHDLPIGLLLGRHDPGADLQTPGAGLQRHRAVLFKYVCDSLSICKSALLWDAKRDTAINLAWTGGPQGRPVRVDITDEPGQLQEAFDLHHVVMQLEGNHNGAIPTHSPPSGVLSPGSHCATSPHVH